MTSLLPSEVLSRAADLIEPEGAWIKKRFLSLNLDGTISRCVACALSQVRGHDISPDIKALGFKSLWAMTSWNDVKRRTQSEVVSALRAASELARREGK